ncbi:MAG: hypothetical protein HYW23_04700 [Candidatus Aenigmarchaeota archaeon]|nr:hypothetical protein [Candidatus Aenigmarchaeota archaeon]
MKEEIKLEPSEELAYWTGVIQTDGSLKYSKKFRYWRISLYVSSKSLEMLREIQELTPKLIKRQSRIWKDKKEDMFYWHIGVSRLLKLKIFEKSDIKFGDPPKPPIWCTKTDKLFGAYLAGLIDGDGSVFIVKRYGDAGYDCRTQITSGSAQIELKSMLEKILGCSVRVWKCHPIIWQKGYHLDFLISSKTIEFIQKYVLPWIQISRKRQVIEKFVGIRGWSRPEI